ncbi:MAG: hypothetical protein O7H41_20800 [Planctomycetota bacterium]|nr:hypothetical protein [Planctomycetota bacterium]
MEDGREVLRRADALYRELRKENSREMTAWERRKGQRKPMPERRLAKRHKLSRGYLHGLLFLADGLTAEERRAVQSGSLSVAAAMRLHSLKQSKREQVRKKIRMGEPVSMRDVASHLTRRRLRALPEGVAGFVDRAGVELRVRIPWGRGGIKSHKKHLATLRRALPDVVKVVEEALGH